MNVRPTKFMDMLVPEDGDGELIEWQPELRLRQNYIGHVSGDRCSVSGSEIVTECCIFFGSCDNVERYNDTVRRHNDTVRRVVNRCIWQRSDCKDSLKKLTIVQSLGLKDLHGNYGILEPQIASFHHLKHLILEETEYTRDLHHIGLLSNLEILEMDYLTVDLPNEIFQLQNLKVLKLKCGSFTPSSEQANWLRKLEHLELWGGSTLTPEILSIVSLKTLIVRQSNALHNIPTEIDRLINLEALIFHECEYLMEVPNSVENLKKLTKLKLTKCFSLSRMGGSNRPPIEFKNIKHLVSLSISGEVRHIPPDISDLVNLENLDIDCLHLASIPEKAIKGLPNLSDLSVTIYDDFPGSLPNICPRNLLSLTVRSNNADSFQNQILDPPLKEYCPSLESFVVKSRPSLLHTTEDDDIAKLAKSLPRTLRHLDGMHHCLLNRHKFPERLNRVNCGIPICDMLKIINRHKIRGLIRKYDRLYDVYANDLESRFFQWKGLNLLITYEKIPKTIQGLMYKLMLNKCGRRTYSNPKPLPESMWPDVLAKVHDRVHGSVLYYKKLEEDCNIIAASVVFSLIQSEALLSAFTPPMSDDICPTACKKSRIM